MAAKDEGALLVQPDPVLAEDDAPDLTTDPLSDTVALLAEMPFSEIEELRNVVTEGRERGYLTPEEIAAMVRYLAGPGARYITGQTIHVNGGAYLG